MNTMSIPNILDENVIPKRYDVRTMADKEQPRSIRFPQKLWDAIDRDAIRCGRSAVKQMEILLSVYYELRNVDIDHDRLSEMRPNNQQASRPNGITLADNSPHRLKAPKTQPRRKKQAG
jgi:hypothetical protein